jgi:hypothetical protein
MADSGSWYNGYSPEERNEKFKVLKRLLKAGEVAAATGPCALCGDPEVPVEYHSEDYAAPFRWYPPAMYSLCRNCHRHKLHKRFGNPWSWNAFVAHVRRGGYAREIVKVPSINAEVRAYRMAVEGGQEVALRPLRPYAGRVGEEWFAHLRMDLGSLLDPAARPR